MNFFLCTILLLSSIAAAAHLDGRQVCYEDNCLRAVNGTRKGQSHPVTGFKNCTDYMTTTILEDPITKTKTEMVCFTSNPTATDFITPSAIPSLRQAQVKRILQLEARATTTIPTHGTIPYYATSACNEEHYSSACSCIGVEPATITQANYTVTRTITVPTTDLTNGCKSELPTSTTKTSLAIGSSNSTVSIPATSSTFRITLSFNSSTTTTVITLTSLSGSATGTIPSSILPSTTPPWLNSTTAASYNATSTATCSTCITVTTNLANATTSFTSSSSLSSMSSWANSTTSYNATSTTASTTDTASPTTSDVFPTPTICGGATVELCNGTCSDLSTDVRNCGVCNNSCAPDHTCTNGVCTRPPCDSTCLEQNGCGPADSTCICGLESGGAGVCFQGSGLCSNFNSCAVTADCDLGFVCVPENCCGVGKCLNTEGCVSQGFLRLGLGSVRRVKEFEGARIGEMNLLGGYLV